MLDRVLASAGPARLWAAASARLRAQAAWDSPHTQGGKVHRALAEPSVYGLALRFRALLPRRTVLRGCAELESLQALLSPDLRQPLRSRLSLRSAALLPGHELAVDAGWAQQAWRAGGQGYAGVPHIAAVSVSPLRRGPLRYRLGVVSSPLPPAGGEASPAPLSPHAQAGVELGGTAAFYPRGSAEQPASRRGSFSLLPLRSRLTLSAHAGALARAPLSRPSPTPAPPPPPAAATPAQAVAQAAHRLASATRVEGLAFGSLGAGVQLGGFSRPFLDYTLLQLRCDARLGSGALAVPVSEASQLSLAKRCASQAAESLSLRASLTQQVVGPLRLRAEARLPVARLRAGWASAAPAAVETAFGVDLALPQVQGAARLVAWYCPQRAEAMAELRLLEM